MISINDYDFLLIINKEYDSKSTPLKLVYCYMILDINYIIHRFPKVPATNSKK